MFFVVVVVVFFLYGKSIFLNRYRQVLLNLIKILVCVWKFKWPVNDVEQL